jgi:hypothetical protein
VGFNSLVTDAVLSIQGGQDFLCTPGVRIYCFGNKIMRLPVFRTPRYQHKQTIFQVQSPLPSAMGASEVRLSGGLGKDSYDRL